MVLEHLQISKFSIHSKSFLSQKMLEDPFSETAPRIASTWTPEGNTGVQSKVAKLGRGALYVVPVFLLRRLLALAWFFVSGGHCAV